MLFQKWIIFVFTDSWSRDQVMQRAYTIAFYGLGFNFTSVRFNE